MKHQQDTIADFHELVNMSASELDTWLKSDDSKNAGWPKGKENRETVGHESGRQIVKILKANPEKNHEKYTEDQIKHMGKVVSYCKRHLAQEEGPNSKKSAEEVKKTKSYASLKNWGHDLLKTREECQKKEQYADEGEKNNTVQQSEKEEKHGEKRKSSADQPGTNKRRETRQAAKKNANGPKGGVQGDDKENDQKAHGTVEQKVQDTESKKSDAALDEGDTVSWNWGNGQPKGKVLEVKDEKASIKTKKGNVVSRNGTARDPAVVIDSGRSTTIKLKHELNGTA